MMYKSTTTILVLSSTFVSISAGIDGPLTPDFTNWLMNNGYADLADSFVRADLKTRGSFGGRLTPNETIDQDPVIFVHGNSDQALSGGKLPNGETGFDNTIDYLLHQGYKTGEIYATTWGPAKFALASDQTHSCDYVMLLRKFTEAVIGYTGAAKVDIIGHSMGVTLARKVVQGGPITQKDGTTCHIGDSIKDKVDTFLGICGGNRGLTACFIPGYEELYPTCNRHNGFWPGTCLTGICENASGLTEFLQYLQKNPGSDGDFVYSFWSRADELIGGMDLVWGHPTSAIPGQAGQRVSDTHTHMQMKEKTAEWQYLAINKHQLH